jgi:uncharacterized protein
MVHFFTQLNTTLQRTLRSILSIALVSVLMASLVVLPADATNIYDVPDFEENAHVVDQAEVLSRATEGKINSAFREIEAKTGQEAYVVTVRRLDYEVTIESFTQDLFKRWFPDAADQKNVTLLAIDVQTDNTAIVTGDGVKPVMSDAIATSVAKETVLVPLKYGNKYNQAFSDATDRLVAVLGGQEDPGAPVVKDTVNVESTFASREETEESNGFTWVIVLLVLSTVIPMATYYAYIYMGNR